jgi:ABC-type glutathione transport system ATPase component
VAAAPTPVVEVAGVGRTFASRGIARDALADVSFTLRPGGTLAVVGESGAGKSTLVRLIAGLDRPTSGHVKVAGRPPSVTPGKVSAVQMVFQHPADALNPFVAVGRSVAEPLRAQPRRARPAIVAELLARVGVDPGRMGERPRRFSGGQLQRIVLARALAARPAVLLCDEPTSALDASVQAQILNLIIALQAAQAFSCILVTHDLPVAKVLADEVLVLRHGRVVEQSRAEVFFDRPTEAYSRALLNAFTW